MTDLRYRQSRLRSFIECPRRTVHETGGVRGTVGASADLGSAFHATAAEILKTLWRAGEPTMATEEAVVIMREVLDEGPWVLDAPDDRWLRQMVCSFVAEPWNPARFLAIEDRLSFGLPCPDGEVRLLTGTPDLVIADPPRGLVIVDHKTGMGRPRDPREAPPEGEPIRGEEYMSAGAGFQLYVYGLLAFKQWPRAQTVTLREKNWRWGGPPREATMGREALEHVEPYVARVMMQLDGALTAGEAEPRPGPHCTTRCPVTRSCPVPSEQRGLGVLTDLSEATSEAERWVTIRALDKQMREALKAHHEATGTYIPVGDKQLGWHADPRGGRKFEMR